MTSPQESTPTRETTRSGVGIFSVAAFVTILLGTFKVFGLFEIGWLAVFMPLILAGGLAVLGLILALLLVGIVAIAKSLGEK